MADDIVTRLRERAINWEVNGEFDPNIPDAVLDSQAADEIERLRAEMERLRAEMERLRAEMERLQRLNRNLAQRLLELIEEERRNG